MLYLKKNGAGGRRGPAFTSIRRRLWLAAAVFLLASWCGGAPAEMTESAVLSDIAENAILPTLTSAARTADDLAEAARELCDHPDDEHLARARDAWREAYLAWKRATPFLFGPAGKIERFIDSWPVNAVVLDAAVADGELAHLLDSADVRGYAGAEHMLFTPAEGAAATEGGRCDHLADVTREIAERTEQVRKAWEEAYKATFVSAGDGKPFLIPADALSLVMAEALNVTEAVLRDDISVPSGFFEDAVKPEYLEAYRSECTVAGFGAVVEGIRLAVFGGGDISMARLAAVKDGLVEKKNPALAARTAKQMDRIEKTLSALEEGGNVHDRLEKKPAVLKRLYKRLQVLQDQMVEMALVLELDVRSSDEATE